MPEIKVEAKTYIVKQMCDLCEVGEMLPTEDKIAWLTDPIQFPHQCNVCGITKAYTTRYPYVMHEWINATNGTS